MDIPEDIRVWSHPEEPQQAANDNARHAGVQKRPIPARFLATSKPRSFDLTGSSSIDELLDQLFLNAVRKVFIAIGSKRIDADPERLLSFV